MEASGAGFSPSAHDELSMITVVDAASASERNVSGRARTSLRSAALSSGVADDDGPATRNRARASAALRPLRSVRAPPDELPAAVAALVVSRTGHAGHARGLEVSAGGALRYLELLGDLGRGDLPARREEHEDGHQPVGAHRPILAQAPFTR